MPHLLFALLGLFSATIHAGGQPRDSLSDAEFSSAISFWLSDIGSAQLGFTSGGTPAIYAPKQLGPAQYPYGSETKLFTAVLTMKMVELGAIGLEDPVSKFHLGIPNDGSITIEQLLTHTSGLPEYFYDVDPAAPANEEQCLKMIRAVAAKAMKPQGKFFYSNSNYFLLGRICELVGGEKLADLYSHFLFTPLHLGCGCTKLPTFDTNWYGGAGCLGGSLQDLLNFTLAVSAQDSRLLTASSWQTLLRPYVPTSNDPGAAQNSNYGFGNILTYAGNYPASTHFGTVPEEHGEKEFVSFYVLRRDSKHPMSMAGFFRDARSPSRQNALFGAFACCCAIVDTKRWITELCGSPSQDKIKGWIAGGEINPDFANVLTPQALNVVRTKLGSPESLLAQGEEVHNGTTTIIVLAKGSTGTMNVTARYGANGILMALGFQPAIPLAGHTGKS